MIVDIALVLGGLALLVLGGDLLVKGAVNLALRLGITPLVVGLTVVAFGTSAPELIVSLSAALGGSTDIAMGNVVGSNIANVLVILGAAALISGIPTRGHDLRESWTMMIGAVDANIPHTVGLVTLWGAAVLTVITGWDYLRVGLKHMD